MLNTTKTKVAPVRPNVLLNRLVTRTITPFVLLTGLILLVVFNYHSVLQSSTDQFSIIRGQQSYSVGGLQTRFTQNAGDQRPSVLAQGSGILSWVEWNSKLSVDGEVFTLWDSGHGYEYDDGKRQIYSTATGHGVQIIEIVTAVDDHTVTVEYRLAAQPVGQSGVQHVVLNIAHYHQGLYQPVVSGNTLVASVLPDNVYEPKGETALKPFGKMAFTVSGPQLASSPLRIDDWHVDTTADGSHGYANYFTTTYAIDNPTVNEVVPLGTETLTFQAG